MTNSLNTPFSVNEGFTAKHSFKHTFDEPDGNLVIIWGFGDVVFINGDTT
jgi:hypothetical protein